jgi:hypothetical protein
MDAALYFFAKALWGVSGSLSQKAASRDQGPSSTESTQKVRVSKHVGFTVLRQSNLSGT